MVLNIPTLISAITQLSLLCDGNIIILNFASTISNTPDLEPV